MRKVATIFLLLLIACPSFAASKISWFRTLDAALEYSANHSKPIFVDAYADWCLWCHKLDREVYADPKFIKFMNDFVPLKMDVEDQSEGSRFAERYQVTGLPTLLVLDSTGYVVDRISGYSNAATLIEGIKSMQQSLEAERKNPGNLEVTFRLAEEYMFREMNEEAEIRYSKILQSTKSPAVHKQSAQFSIGLSQYYQGKLSRASASLEAYISSYPQGESLEDAYLLLSQIHLEDGNEARARFYLQEFLRKFPKSRNVIRAEQVLLKLEEETGGSLN